MMANHGPQGRGYNWFWNGLYPSGVEIRREREKKGARPEMSYVSDGCLAHPDQKCLECPEDKCLLDGRQELTRVVFQRQLIRKLVKSKTPSQIARELHLSGRSVYRYLQNPPPSQATKRDRKP